MKAQVKLFASEDAERHFWGCAAYSGTKSALTAYSSLTEEQISKKATRAYYKGLRKYREHKKRLGKGEHSNG